MSIHVLEEESRKLIDAGTHAILLESDIEDNNSFHLAIRELQHADARNAAISAATRLGIPNARVGMPSHPYPVDKDGQSVVRPMEQEVHRYRIEIEVTGKAV
jgi:hypothetical protein